MRPALFIGTMLSIALASFFSTDSSSTAEEKTFRKSITGKFVPYDAGDSKRETIPVHLQLSEFSWTQLQFEKSHLPKLLAAFSEETQVSNTVSGFVISSSSLKNLETTFELKKHFNSLMEYRGVTKKGFPSLHNALRKQGAAFSSSDNAGLPDVGVSLRPVETDEEQTPEKYNVGLHILPQGKKPTHLEFTMAKSQRIVCLFPARDDSGFYWLNLKLPANTHPQGIAVHLPRKQQHANPPAVQTLVIPRVEVEATPKIEIYTEADTVLRATRLSLGHPPLFPPDEENSHLLLIEPENQDLASSCNVLAKQETFLPPCVSSIDPFSSKSVRSSCGKISQVSGWVNIAIPTREGRILVDHSHSHLPRHSVKHSKVPVTSDYDADCLYFYVPSASSKEKSKSKGKTTPDEVLQDGVQTQCSPWVWLPRNQTSMKYVSQRHHLLKAAYHLESLGKSGQAHQMREQAEEVKKLHLREVLKQKVNEADAIRIELKSMDQQSRKKSSAIKKGNLQQKVNKVVPQLSPDRQLEEELTRYLVSDLESDFSISIPDPIRGEVPVLPIIGSEESGKRQY